MVHCLVLRRTPQIPPQIMLEHRRLAGCLNASVVALALLVPSVALAATKDKPATALANEAMQTDYVGTQFKKAEQKLKKAITLCGDSACSYDVVGRLHRDLATVYIGGLGQAAKGKAELKRALEANPELQLDNDLATAELRKAFKELGGHDSKKADEEPDEEPGEDEPKAPPPKEKKEEDCEPGSDGCEKEAAAEPEAAASSPGKFAKNWLSLHFEQDFLIYGGKDNVCARSNVPDSLEAPGYYCFQAGAQFGYSAGQDIQPGVGNRVSGGVGLATSRILLGFDRLVSANVSIGARVGFAFGGSPTPYTNVKFLPLHGEIRGNYWFGSNPFESSSLRPYASLSAGVAEVDGHVLVEYYDNLGNKGTLDAWRKTGKAFVGLGFGLMIPIGSSGIVPEVRAMQMLGDSGTALDASLGYAYGF